MQKDQFENILTITAVLSQKRPSTQAVFIARNLAKLQRLAVSLRKRYEAARNYQWACTEKYEKVTARHQAKAAELAAEMGIALKHQKDSRGCALYLIIDDREYGVF